MRAKRILGTAGVSAVVGATVVIPAGLASAGTTYNSTAAATAGTLTVMNKGVALPEDSVKATDAAPSQSGFAGVNSLNGSIPSSGQQIARTVENQLPAGDNLSMENATANPDGSSTACAGFLTKDCFTAPAPVTVNVPLSQIPGVSTVLPLLQGAGQGAAGSSDSSGGSGVSPSTVIPKSLPTSLPKSLPTSLPGVGKLTRGLGSASSGSAPSSGSSSSASSPYAQAAAAASDDTVVLTVTGPDVQCTAGPANGTSGFTATQYPASIEVNILQGTTSLLPNGPVKLHTGSLTSQITGLQGGLQNLLSALNANLTIQKGTISGEGQGPTTTATAGPVGLTVVNGTQALELKGAKAVCGPNEAAKGGGSTTPKTTTTSTSGETPLGGGIQTDEGRSGSGPGAGAWAGAAGAGTLGAAGTALVLWRRRRLTP